MITPVNNYAAISSSQTNPAKPAVDPMATEQTFLKLLVTQLKNQDPSSPQDPMQFVTQLAQFSNLEQTVQMRQDLDAINISLKPSSTPATTKV